jgi:hypothetical protein
VSHFNCMALLAGKEQKVPRIAPQRDTELVVEYNCRAQVCPDTAHKPNSGSMTTQAKIKSVTMAGIIKVSWKSSGLKLNFYFVNLYTGVGLYNVKSTFYKKCFLISATGSITINKKFA